MSTTVPYPFSKSQTWPAVIQRVSAGFGDPSWLRHLSYWLVLAALIEFVLLRVVIRLGPMLPQRDEMQQVGQVILASGAAAMNAAMLLAILCLFLLAGSTAHRVLRGLLVACAALFILRIAWGALNLPGRDVLFLLYSVTILATMALALFQAPQRRRVLLAILFVTYCVIALPVASGAAARAGWEIALPSLPTALLVEGLAVTVALVALATLRPARHGWAFVAALMVAAFFSAGSIAAPWIVNTYTQWSVGFTGALPWWVYAAGLAAFTYTVLSSRRTQPLLVYGLLLIACGGLRWDYSYYNALSLLGFLLLTTLPVQVREQSGTQPL